MAVDANTLETYDSLTIREELSDMEHMISPYDTPFQSIIAGSGSVENTYFEWPLVELAAVDNANRVIEGDDDVAPDASTLALRRGNYTQLSDKLVSVSDTSQRVDGAAMVEKMSRQITYKLRELKRDCETMLLDNVAAAPGSSGNARATAGLPAFIIDNASRGATGTAPTLSGTNNGYPDAAAGDGTPRGLTETLMNDIIQQVWTEGGDPRYVLCDPVNKRNISEVFTGRGGNATLYKDGDDKQLVTAVDVYQSDFGTVSILPDRWQRARDLFVIDPEYVRVDSLIPTNQKPIARTGHSEKRLIQKEYGLFVGNNKALGIVADLDGTAT